MPQLTTLIDKFLRRLSMTDAEKASLRNDLSVINADRTNVNFAVPGPYTDDLDAYANGVGYGEMYRKPDGTLSWIFEDIDAQLYLAEVQAALGATTIEAALPNATNPRKIISDFYRAEKDAGRYSLHKRIYLPIYNNLAANAVDAITTTSGTFTGTVTVAPGYVQGDGSTGYFNSNIGLPAVGGSNGNGSMWQIIPQRVPGINRYEGINGPLLERISSGTSSVNFNQFVLPSNNSALTIAINETSAGILIGSTTSTSSRFVKFLKSEVFTTQANTTMDTSTIPSGNLFFLARNNNDTGIIFPHTERRGGYGFGIGLTEAQAEGYALNLKSLYESLTGIALP